ncbi:5' nucleotidase [Gordonia phage Bantam]|uniref:5' nucleotidase n=1 Tax=Gordonia phage Bantam TaxID=1887641 RepID=A0A1B3AYH5_9CAUD|nr:5' nucleotidase [Gordonia phage Bantam]AOE43806.1 5' nucleotidase [Gordonia phage Bantam]
MARIMLDLDGVIFDFVGALRDFMTDDLGFNADDLPEPTEWAFYEEWGLTAKGFEMVYNNAILNGELFTQLPAREADVTALHWLRDRLHTIHIVTARGMGASAPVAHLQTVEWLRVNNIPYDTLTFASDKTLIQTDYALEDRRENYKALRANKTEAFLFDQPYNQDVPGCSKRSRRVRSVYEFAQAISRENQPF